LIYGDFIGFIITSIIRGIAHRACDLFGGQQLRVELAAGTYPRGRHRFLTITGG
jgi:hypothetical protein